MSGRLFTPPDDQSFQPRAIVPQASVGSAGAVGSAMAQFGGALAAEAEQFRATTLRAEAANAEARTRASMTVELARLQASLNEGDPATIETRWNEGTAALRQAAREQVPERQRGLVDRLTEQLVAAQMGRVLAIQGQRTGDVARADLVTGVDALIQAAAAEADPQRRAEYLTTIEAAVSGNVAGGVIGAEAGARMLAGARRRLNYGIARGMVQAQRGAGPQVLDDLPLPPLPPEEMASLRQEAAAAFSAYGQEAAAEERAVVASRQALVTETFSRALAGGDDAPSVEEVEALRFDLPPTRFRAALVAATGEAAEQDNPSEVGAALLNLDSDDLEDQLDDAIARGDLTPATRTRLVEERDAIRSDPVLRRRRADARAAIDRVIPRCGTDAECEDMWGPEGVSDIAGETLDEWTTWARGNPQASLQDIEQARATFAQRARDRVVERLLGRLDPLPGVPRQGNAPYGTAEIEAFESDTLAALDAGQMDESEAGWRLSLANYWRAIAPDAEDGGEEPDAGAGRSRMGRVR